MNKAKNMVLEAIEKNAENIFQFWTLNSRSIIFIEFANLIKKNCRAVYLVEKKLFYLEIYLQSSKIVLPK